jgi:hypothetical protein
MDVLQENGEHESVKVEKGHRPPRRRDLLNQRHWGVYVVASPESHPSMVARTV